MKTKEIVKPKPALLLSPQKIFEQNNIMLKTLLVIRNNQSLNYEVGDLNPHSIKGYFPELPKEAIPVFDAFGMDSIAERKKQIKQRFTAQKSGAAWEPFFRQALLRQYQQLFESVKPFTSLVKWYHTKSLHGLKHLTTAPCRFSTYRPQPEFEVVKDKGQLRLLTHIVINGTRYDIDDFQQQQFLLESANEYFLLSWKDFQVLEWVRQYDMTSISTDPVRFAQEVLAELEKDYKVERNNLFDQQRVTVKPTRRVMLSELNNSFIMFRPQWLYDGFTIDGPWQATVDLVQNGEAYSIARDEAEEKELIQLLESLHPNFGNQRNGYYYLSFADAQKKQWFLKAYHQLLMSDIELVGMDMLRHFRYSTNKVETIVNILVEEEKSTELEMMVRFGKEEVPLAELQKMLLAGQRAVLLKDGSLGVLGEDWLKQYSSIIKHGKINGKVIRIARWLAMQEQNSKEAVLPTMKQEWWQRWKTWQEKNETILYTVPDTVQAQLRPYQQKGYEWMRLLSEAGAGGCLADDMGLGKTLQAICFLAAQVEQNPSTRHIIVCPPSLIYNWQQELEKFAPTIKTLVYHGPGRNLETLQEKDLQVIITSYGTLRIDTNTLIAFDYGVSIIDESHNIKNPSAQITQAVNSIQSHLCIALSGTPVVNNTFDLYSQLNVALPGMFGSREFFKKEYADPIDRFGDEDKIQSLQKLTAPFILRRTKEQVASDLPAKTESILWCEMGTGQRELYENIREQIRSSLFLGIKQKGLSKAKLDVIQGILKLRQVCNSPMLLPEDERTNHDSIKTVELLDELKNILPRHKALVFSQFSSMLDLLAKACEEQGIPFYHFDGQTPPHKRTEMVNAFQEEGNSTHLFLISLKAGNAGLTLTAADYVFLFDPWWNTAVQQQAIDRTHRIGQTKNVFAYKMICKDTIEEKIIRLQDKKKQLAEDLIGGDEGFVKNLDEADIAYLFG